MSADVIFIIIAASIVAFLFVVGLVGIFMEFCAEVFGSIFFSISDGIRRLNR